MNMTIDDLSEFQINVIKSTVGINRNVNQQGDFYRNRFIANPDVDEEWSQIKQMVDAGIYGERPADIHMPYKYVGLTEKGLEIARELEEELHHFKDEKN